MDEDSEGGDVLAEAWKRLQKAQYYQVIVLNGVVEEDGSQDAAEVNAEARRWAGQQVAKLVGAAKPEAPVQKVELPFTPQQIEVLIKLADRAMAMGLVGKPTATPQVAKAQKPTAPQVRKVQAATKPAQPKPAVAPAAPEKKPSAPAKGGKKKPLKVDANEEGELDLDKIPTGEVFRDPRDKQLYKMVDNPNFDPDKEGSKPRSKIKVTNQVRPTNAIPIPQGHQMSSITAAQSMETVDAAQSVSASSPFGADEGVNSVTFVKAAAGVLRGED